MKRIIIIIVILFTYIFANSQDYYPVEKAKYGIQYSGFITGGGFGFETELSIKIIDRNKKELIVGPIFYDGYKLSGLSVEPRWNIIYNENYNAYIFYNLLMRKTNVESHYYTSVEHLAGMGFKQKIYGNFYYNVNIGLGCYLGSIEHPAYDETGMYGTNGFSYITRIGLSYNF
jgi:hypothetical protein